VGHRRNVRIDTRWAGQCRRDSPKTRRNWPRLQTEVIMAHGAGPVGGVLQATRTVSIVFPVVVDPVGGGPRRQHGAAGRQTPRVSCFEDSIGGMDRAAQSRSPPGVSERRFPSGSHKPAGTGQFEQPGRGAVAAGSVTLSMCARRRESERAVAAFARSRNGAGLIVIGERGRDAHRDLIITLQRTSQAASRSNQNAPSSPPAALISLS